MGFDPVKIEQCYLALCSVYANHMGQAKQATQVAMKHMISDLQMETAAQDAIPPKL